MRDLKANFIISNKVTVSRRNIELMAILKFNLRIIISLLKLGVNTMPWW